MAEARLRWGHQEGPYDQAFPLSRHSGFGDLRHHRPRERSGWGCTGSWTRSCWSRPAPNPSGPRFGARLRCGTRQPALATQRPQPGYSLILQLFKRATQHLQGRVGRLEVGCRKGARAIGFWKPLAPGRACPAGWRTVVWSRAVPDPVRRGADGVVASRRDLRSAQSPGASPVAAMPASTGVLRHSKADAVLVALSLAHAILLARLSFHPR